MLFDFLYMSGNYESRKVDRYDGPEGFVSTARVTDSRDPYETGIQYDHWGADVVIVQTYKSMDDAVIGHSRYVEQMKSGKLPTEKPYDAGTSEIEELFREFQRKRDEA